MKNLSHIRTVLAEPAQDLRAQLKAALAERGFQDTFATGNMLGVQEAIDRGGVDLLICDTSLPEGDLCGLISDIRHGKIGDNPFLISVTLISHPTPDLIRRVIDSGSDVVLAKPFTPGDLLDRIHSLSMRRMPFVVTTDYVGPDRRQKARIGTMEIPRIQVPNPLIDKRFGQISRGSLARARAAQATISEQKVERHAFQIAYLAARVFPDGTPVDIDDAAQEYLERMQGVVRDFNRRIRSTPYAHAAEIGMAMVDMLNDIRSAENSKDVDQIRLFCRMAQVLKAKCNPHLPITADPNAEIAEAPGTENVQIKDGGSIENPMISEKADKEDVAEDALSDAAADVAADVVTDAQTASPPVDGPSVKMTASAAG